MLRDLAAACGPAPGRPRRAGRAGQAAPAKRTPGVAAAALGLAAAGVSPYENPSPYCLVSTAGVVWPLVGATDYGSLAGQSLRAPIIRITVTPDHQG
jgi:hypothetical protein